MESSLFDDRGLTVGDALFETLLVREGSTPWLDRHLRRLASACDQLGLEYPRELRDEVQALLTDVPLSRAALRITLSRESAGQRGYRPASRRCRRYLQLTPVEAPNRRHWDQGIRAFVCQTRLPEQVELAGLKHNNRLPHVLARAERDPAHFAEGVMLSTSGAVIEGISSNLFIAIDGVLKTPRLERAGVAGIVRAAVKEQAVALNWEVREERLVVADLLRADELFFCNSLMGLWPARALDCHHYRSMELCRQLQSALESHWYA